MNILHTDETYQKIYSEIIDTKNIFSLLLSNKSVLLNKNMLPNILIIDLYGDTVFNQLQIPVLVKEFEITLIQILDEDQKELIRNIISLLKEASGSIHTYIIFLGE